MIRVLGALGAIGLPVLLALHPRTRAVLAAEGETREQIGALTIVRPVGYLESLALIRSAALELTDSGGIQREAYWLGTPCVTLRQETEWTETVDLGANCLVPPESVESALPRAVADQMTRWRGGAGWDRSEYGKGNAAEQVVDAIQQWLPQAE